MLDNLPLATIGFIAIVIAGFYCLVTGQIDFATFGGAVGVGGVGTAAVGEVRTRAGKGVVVRDSIGNKLN